MSLIGAVALGVLIGLSLGALGGGGSILTVPALVYGLHESAQAATTGSLVIVGITALVGSAGHARTGSLRWRSGIIFGAIGMATSFGGTAMNRQVNPDALLLAFGALMIVSAVAMVLRARSVVVASISGRPLVMAGSSSLATGKTGRTDTPAGHGQIQTSPPWRDRRSAAKLVAAGLVVGFLTGFLGVGGGFVIVPALVMLLDFPMTVAVGTSLLVIAINSAGALVARAGTETFHWSVIVPATLAAIVGSQAGQRIADKVPGSILTRAFACLLTAVAIYVITRSVIALT